MVKLFIVNYQGINEYDEEDFDDEFQDRTFNTKYKLINPNMKNYYQDINDPYNDSYFYRQIKASTDWIKLYLLPAKTLNDKMFSYGLKHRVEEYRELINDKEYYVSNGAFIIATIRSGLHLKVSREGPNCHLKAKGNKEVIKQASDKRLYKLIMKNHYKYTDGLSWHY